MAKNLYYEFYNVYYDDEPDEITLADGRKFLFKRFRTENINIDNYDFFKIAKSNPVMIPTSLTKTPDVYGEVIDHKISGVDSQIIAFANKFYDILDKEVLYHGTSAYYLDNIKKNGLGKNLPIKEFSDWWFKKGNGYNYPGCKQVYIADAFERALDTEKNKYHFSFTTQKEVAKEYTQGTRRGGEGIGKLSSYVNCILEGIQNDWTKKDDEINEVKWIKYRLDQINYNLYSYPGIMLVIKRKLLAKYDLGNRNRYPEVVSREAFINKVIKSQTQNITTWDNFNKLYKNKYRTFFGNEWEVSILSDRPISFDDLDVIYLEDIKYNVPPPIPPTGGESGKGPLNLKPAAMNIFSRLKQNQEVSLTAEEISHLYIKPEQGSYGIGPGFPVSNYYKNIMKSDLPGLSDYLFKVVNKNGGNYLVTLFNKGDEPWKRVLNDINSGKKQFTVQDLVDLQVFGMGEGPGGVMRLNSVSEINEFDKKVGLPELGSVVLFSEVTDKKFYFSFNPSSQTFTLNFTE